MVFMCTCFLNIVRSVIILQFLCVFNIFLIIHLRFCADYLFVCVYLFLPVLVHFVLYSRKLFPYTYIYKDMIPFFAANSTNSSSQSSFQNAKLHSTEMKDLSILFPKKRKKQTEKTVQTNGIGRSSKING